MARVVGVHGAFNELWGPNEIGGRWLPAVRDGLWHADVELGADDFALLCLRPARVDPADPTRARRTVVLKWTYDERVEDGLYAAYTIKRFAQMLEDPAAAGLGLEA